MTSVYFVVIYGGRSPVREQILSCHRGVGEGPGQVPVRRDRVLNLRVPRYIESPILVSGTSG